MSFSTNRQPRPDRQPDMVANLNGRIQLVGQPWQPTANGGMADVYRAWWFNRSNNREFVSISFINICEKSQLMSIFVKQLAVKVIRACQLEDPGKSETNRRVCTNSIQGNLNADNAIKKRLHREMEIWSRLNHANVLPFYGISEDAIPGRVALVSPWMDNDTLPSYILRYPTISKSRLVSSLSHTEDCRAYVSPPRSRIS